MSEKVLFVDDDPNILEAYKRNLRRQFAMDTALGPEEGLEAISSKGPYAVIVSDLRMPGMDGIQFLARASKMTPDTVRVMLTGNAEMEAAINAVNEGRIFRFLTKPCPPETVAQTLTAGIEQYRLIMAERELLEKTLSRSVRVLIDILGLVNPLAFSKAARLRQYVKHIVAKLGLSNAWQFELAAMLSQIGCVSLPQETLEKVYAGDKLSEEEEKAYKGHPAVGSRLVVKIPRLEAVGKMIEKQNEPFSGMIADWDPKKQDNVSTGAQILKVALDFDDLIIRGTGQDRAVDRLLADTGARNPMIADALRDIKLEKATTQLKLVMTRDLTPGMIIAEDLRTKAGILLVQKGQEISELLLERLKNFWRNGAIADKLRVHVPLQNFMSDEGEM